MLGFSLTFTFLLKRWGVEACASPTRCAEELTWVMFGEFMPFLDQVDAALGGPGTGTLGARTNMLVRWLLVAYMVATVIMLINLLIAMMSSSFATVKENSRTEWMFARMRLIEDYMDMPALPAPLNLVAAPARLVGVALEAASSLLSGRCWKSRQGSGGGRAATGGGAARRRKSLMRSWEQSGGSGSKEWELQANEARRRVRKRVVARFFASLEVSEAAD